MHAKVKARRSVRGKRTVAYRGRAEKRSTIIRMWCGHNTRWKRYCPLRWGVLEHLDWQRRPWKACAPGKRGRFACQNVSSAASVRIIGYEQGGRRHIEETEVYQ